MAVCKSCKKEISFWKLQDGHMCEECRAAATAKAEQERAGLAIRLAEKCAREIAMLAA